MDWTKTKEEKVFGVKVKTLKNYIIVYTESMKNKGFVLTDTENGFEVEGEKILLFHKNYKDSEELSKIKNSIIYSFKEIKKKYNDKFTSVIFLYY